ncbi:ATP synthase delta chain, chloroplastic-like [Magnolia sinica]|uniref:ATP synthase delta chain, chloroplastic-like n=1 Tax=Magnolia sinica TaxID=86752 RepID=UPI0026590FE3|nr:ATP synthase delta chain, chloroplastic-like [Magnolia sinica]
MSTILNQSITPHRQPSFPSKGATSQDISQHVPMIPSFHESQSLRALQSLKKNTLTTTSAGARKEESFSKNTEVDFEKHKLNGMLDSITNGVCKAPQLFKSEDNFNLLMQPITQIEQLKIHDIVASDAEFKPFNLSFFHSLVENEKSNLIKDVMGELDLFSAKQNDVLVVAVSSAVKLEGKQLDQIARKMQRMTGSDNMRLENTVDPSLIAGFVISYEKEGSHVIDLSVKGQLAELVARIESTDQRIVALAEMNTSLIRES